MKVLVFSAHNYDQAALTRVSGRKHDLVFTNKHLNELTAHMASGFEAVSLFTSDVASAEVIRILSDVGVRFIALRSVGFDHVDLYEAGLRGIRVANVPEYSPYAIAEHAVAMMMAANRKIVESRLLMQLQDFRVDSLTGFDVHGKTVGIIGTGKIGIAFAHIMNGFGTKLIAYDPYESEEAKQLGVQYTTLEDLLRRSDIVSIHCPLNKSTKHMLGKSQFAIMKKGAVLINTARGGVIKTGDLADAIEQGILSVVCLDVYENEKGLFFEDHRADVLNDPLFARLRSFKNVLITGHQGFLTNEAIEGIANVTISNLDFWQQGQRSPNELAKVKVEANA
ncbi:MAG TPA: 2-hydroxyacid dehydrogenase [Cyclobacteriaceae bacterium]|nr:2-hydroxyacid dehydrogenase [Cyclobacteriaceae bacterium]